MKEKTLVRVCIKLNKTRFIEIAELAQKAGVRGRGVLLFVKEHGFEQPNTKGLAKFLGRFLIQYYKDTEPARLEHQAQLLADKRKIDEELAKTGQR